MHSSADAELRPRRRRLRRARLLRRFARDRKGATAVEFALIALPFIALMFAILETGYLYFAEQILETAVDDTARLIRTGQAQEQKLTATAIKADICDRVVAIPNCTSKLQIDVRTSSTFDSIDLSTPVVNGELKTDNFTYSAGHGGDIVVVRAFYEWPTFVKLLGQNYANLSDGNHLISATAAFKNEPFTW
jgi:Flp pilus assembly protein TadG